MFNKFSSIYFFLFCHLRFIYRFLPFLFLHDAAIASQKNVVTIQHWQTKNGMQVYFVSNKQLPILDIQVVFQAGSSRDEKLFGLALLTNNMLNQGTNSMNTDEIANRFEQVGAIYSTGVDRDKAYAGLRSLTTSPSFSSTLQLFSTVLTQANFPEKALQRLKKQILTAIQEQQQSPLSLAYNTFENKLYGDHPYGHPILGTTQSVSRLTQEDVKRFYHKYYVARNAMLAMVGNIDKQQAVMLSEQIAEALPTGEAAEKLSSVTSSKKQGEIIHYPSEQTSVFLGTIGIARKDPDFFSLHVGNAILGGSSLSSRLFEEVRNKRGLCYGISSRWVSTAMPGPFYIVLQTRNEQLKEAIQVTQQTLEKFLREGPTEEELNRTKQFLVKSFPFSIASNSALLDKIVMIGFYQLPLNYLDTYRDRINAVTGNDIQLAFKKHLHMDRIIAVTAGGESHEKTWIRSPS